jgi:hypothetical protein
MAYDLSREEEIQLFKDIKDNQKPMNTSHFDGIEILLTPQEQLKKRNPELYIAQRLGRDLIIKVPVRDAARQSRSESARGVSLFPAL